MRRSVFISLCLSCAVTSISPVKNSAVNVESSEDDDSSSEEETPSGKGAITVRGCCLSVRTCPDAKLLLEVMLCPV